MLVEAVAVLGWVIGGGLPPDYLLLRAEEYPDGEQVVYYGHDLRDPDDAPVELRVHLPGEVPVEPDTTVHGQPADLDDLTDDGSVYGRVIRWDESGVQLSVGVDGKPSDGYLHALAEAVVSVP